MPSSSPCPLALIEFAERLADANAAHALGYFHGDFGVETKPDLPAAALVTVADKEGESLLRRLIEAAYPEHGIRGEEFDTVRPDAEYLWILDPIDGTDAFVAGSPLFGQLIGLLHRGEPILGVIDMPAVKHRAVGARGHPTRVDGLIARGRACAELSQAALHCPSPHYIRGPHWAPYLRLAESVRVACYGVFAYGYALLASGRADLAVDGSLGAHDYMPLIPIIEGAGGIITDWEGRALALDSATHILAAADPALHTQALAVLQGGESKGASPR